MLQYVLRFVAGKDQGREFPLPQDLNILIGRVSDVDVLMLDEKVSRKHAKISTHGGKVVIEDLASRNGTFVNGARIRNTELKEGDQIVIGSSTIKLVSMTAPSLRPAPSATPLGAQPAADEVVQKVRAMTWIRVRILVSLGAAIRPSSGCGVPPSLARTSWGRSAAWSPASRKFRAPASAHATAAARTKVSR